MSVGNSTEDRKKIISNAALNLPNEFTLKPMIAYLKRPIYAVNAGILLIYARNKMDLARM